MYFINKGDAPELLTEYKASAGATFEGLPTDTKDELKKQLLNEQGYTCAYCMQRIKLDSIK